MAFAAHICMKYTLWENQKKNSFQTNFQFLPPLSLGWLAGVWMFGWFGWFGWASRCLDAGRRPLCRLSTSTLVLNRTALWPLHTLRHRRNGRHNCVRHCARCRVCAVDGKAAKRKHISNSLWWPHHHHGWSRHYSLELLLAPHHPTTICNMGWLHRMRIYASHIIDALIAVQMHAGVFDTRQHASEYFLLL